MTSKILSTKKSFLGNFAKQNIWLFIMSSIITSFATVIPIIIQILNAIRRDNGRVYVEEILYENAYLMIISVILAIVSSVSVFKYLNSRPEVDLYYSLPIKLEKIFAVRYIVGALSFIIAITINFAISIIIASVANIDIAYIMKDVLLFLMSNIFIYLSVYSYTAFATIITGNIFMSVCVSVGFIFAPTAIIMSLNQLCSNFLKFYSYNSELVENVINYTSPIGVLFIIGIFFENLAENNMFFIIQAIVFTALSFVYFMKRPSENSSNPVAVNIFKPIIKGIGVICATTLGGVIFLLFTYSDDLGSYLIGAFIIGFIVHMIFEMLFELDVRAGLKNIWHFGLHFGFVVLVIICISMDLFGYQTKIAPINEIKGIIYENIEITDPESIKILHAYMETCIEKLNSNDVYANSSYERATTLYLTVNLNDGTSYTRDYNNIYISKDDVISIETTKEFIEKFNNYNFTNEQLLNISDNYNNNLYISYDGGTEHLNYNKFEQVYKLAVEQKDLITEEFLEFNVPVLNIYYFNAEELKRYIIPIYSVQTKALEYLDVKTPNLSANTIQMHLYEISQLIDSSPKRLDINERIIEEMTPTYSYVINHGNYNSNMKDIVKIYDEKNIGSAYISLEKLDEILAEFNIYR